VGAYRERLIDFTIAQGIQIEFKESIAPTLGMSYGDRIALLPGQDKAERRTATTRPCPEPKPKRLRS